MTASPTRRFLVLHGWTNRRERGHWHRELVDELRASGEQVLYPQLPGTDAPTLASWTDVLRAELDMLGGGERVVVAHSLATMLWLHATALLTGAERVDRVLLVAPPSPRQLALHDETAEFSRVKLDPVPLARAARSTRMVYGVGDEWAPEGADVAFAQLGLDCDRIPGGAHLNPDSGYGRWPSMAAWCRDPATRLTAR